jgi:hypothetical protein
MKKKRRHNKLLKPSLNTGGKKLAEVYHERDM